MKKTHVLAALVLAGSSMNIYADGARDLKGAAPDQDCVRDLKGECLPEVAPEPLVQEPSPVVMVEPEPVTEVDRNWYVGASVGGSIYQDACDGGEDSDTAANVYVGYQFNENFAVEGGYHDLGSINSMVGNCSSPEPIDPSADGLSVSVLGRAPVSDRVAVFGRAGAMFWNMDVDASANAPAVSDNGVSPLAGVGVGVAISERIEGRVEYNRFFDVGEQETTGQTDIDTLTAGVAVKF